MQQFISRAIVSGLTRAEAYLIWQRAVSLKQAKVQQTLLARIEDGSLTWSEIASAARTHKLNQNQFNLLKRRFFSYRVVR